MGKKDVIDEWVQVATPADPDAGYSKPYFKSDGKLYGKTGSTETLIGPSAGGGSSVQRWDLAAVYSAGDVVGYAGKIWRAVASVAANKPPSLNTILWQCIHGSSFNSWAQFDPFFSGSDLSSWDLFWTVGTAVPTLTNTAGEFETGIQALKISSSAGSSKRIFEKTENIVRGGELITVQIRARIGASSANSPSINAQLFQNDSTGFPGPFASGVVVTSPFESPQLLTTSWATYTFNVRAVNAKPRSTFHVTVDTGSTVAETTAFLIDRIEITRGGIGNIDTVPIGAVQAWGGLTTAIPSGFLLCDGTAVSRSTYAQLYAAIGTSHGVGDGSTTFNLPNLKGRVAVGYNSADTEFNTIGKTGGAKTHTLTSTEQANMALRSADGYPIMNGLGGSSPGYYLQNAGNTGNANGAYALGGAGAHNNLQPFSTLCYIIKAGSTATVATPLTGAVSATYSVNHVGFRTTSPYPLTNGRITINMPTAGQALIQARTDVSSISTGYAVLYQRIGSSDDSTLEQFFEVAAVSRRQMISTLMTWLPAGPTSLMAYIWQYAMPASGPTINSTHWTVQTVGSTAPTLTNA